ncbi:hypothetical protein [Ferrovum myxofaciens]|uniref:hypothetical protein n=1 Tax=Ferrovum myxofaciens TaxID=416213 RepID=UPI0023571D04|nr:hypothetical protein [Ferrovum myxofaciens]MBU6995914.1 hypothetical protein [Ferrovum myxofaciens]
MADVVNGTPEFMDGFNVLKSALTQMRMRIKALEEDIKHLAALPPKQRRAVRYYDEDGTPIDANFLIEAKAAAIAKGKEFIDRHTEPVWAFDTEIARQLVLSGKFITGRKLGTGSPIRKCIAKHLRKTPSMTNESLWDAVKENPPNGFTVCDNRAGKYIEGPAKFHNMNFERFCNVCAEERKALKG